MQQKRRSIGFTLTILCTLTLLLAACRTGTTSSNHTTTQNTLRLNVRATGTTTPGTATISPTEYVGQVPTENAWVGLSTTGKRMVAFVTDGTKGHNPTFAQWFRGPVTNGVVDTTATAKNGSDRLQATLSKDTTTGTVTLANGKSVAFTANAVPASAPYAGLYRSEHVVNNQRYAAGWVVLPPAGATGTATPSATGTTSPSATGTASPSVTGTASPSATGTATGMLQQQGGALLNEQNYTVQPVPPLTQAQVNSKQTSIPNMGTFNLVPCQKNLC
ncbi:MAG TPA: hypothetical protein VGM01_12485 [Ktedonobacteraceae bacterium]